MSGNRREGSAWLCRTLCLAAAMGWWTRGALRPASAAGGVEGAPAAVVIGIQGRPKVKHGGKGEGEVLRMNDHVYGDDVVVTGLRERVALAFLGLGAPEVKIDENSEFTVDQVATGDRPSQLFSSLGRAWARLTGGTHGMGGMNFRTPQAVAAVRGTEADVGVTQQQLTVKVYEGFVDVMNKKGSQRLQAGQMTSVASPAAAPLPPKTMTAQDKTNWFESLKADVSSKQMQALQREAQEKRDLELTTKDGKKIKLHFQKNKK